MKSWQGWNEIHDTRRCVYARCLCIGWFDFNWYCGLQLEDKDVVYFKSILPEKSVLERDAITSEQHTKYTCDWYNMFRANTSLILLPETTDQVSKILKYCNDECIAVVPQGGNTGASGGVYMWIKINGWWIQIWKSSKDACAIYSCKRILIMMM